MGAGSSQEAPYSLKAGASLPAGNYHFELDAVITLPVDTTFDWIWRHGDGSPDTILAEWTEHYEPRGGGNFDAQPFDYDQNCVAVTAQTGDQLVFKYTGSAGSMMDSYIPNGDGAFSHGRIPHVILPK